MTIHIKKRHYQIPRNGIQLVYVRKSGMWTVFVNNKNCLQRYKYESVYGWYTKVIWITGFQNLRYIFRYMISLVSERYTNKKRRIKSYTDLFSLLWGNIHWCSCNSQNGLLWEDLPSQWLDASVAIMAVVADYFCGSSSWDCEGGVVVIGCVQYFFIGIIRFKTIAKME